MRFFLVFVLLMGQLVNAQTPEGTHQTLGVELDALPYIAGGLLWINLARK